MEPTTKLLSHFISRKTRIIHAHQCVLSSYVRHVSSNQQDEMNPVNAKLKRTFSDEDVREFARLTGDFNSIHLNQKYAQTIGFEKPIVHGALLNGLVSAVIGTVLPGPGTLVVKQTLNFPQPLFVGETVTALVEIISRRKSITHCSFKCQTDDGKIVMHGDAKLVVKNSQN